MLDTALRVNYCETRCETDLMAVSDALNALIHKRSHKLWITLVRATPNVVPG
jgi:hypothetical protein